MVNITMFHDLSFPFRPVIRRYVWPVVGFLVFVAFMRTFRYDGYIGPQRAPPEGMATAPHKPAEKALVVSSLLKDNTDWIPEFLPGWELNRYVADDNSAKLKVPKNKGREAMTYLTYIIDHYNRLPDLVIFMHAERFQWHNDDPLYDGVPMFQSLQIPYLFEQGYTNLRCVWTLGCPSEISFETAAKEHVDSKTAQASYYPAFAQLFPNINPAPPAIGVGCCAQFALTRDKIRTIPLEEYTRWRQWLLDTPLEDHVSGRIMEYSWHILYGKPAVHCPNTKECYCRLYGLCDLECNEEGRCGDRWVYPPFATLPDGWPIRGWNDEIRTQEQLNDMRDVAQLHRAIPPPPP